MNAGTERPGEMSARRPARLAWLIMGTLALAFLIAAWLTLSDYGITWDEPENFLSGDLYLRFFRTGDRAWLDFETLKNAWALSEQRPYFYVYTFARQERYPPVANLVSAMTAWLLDERRGWLNPIDAHHAAVPIFGAIGILATSAFAWRATRRLTPALVAGLGLALFPIYWGHAHNNVKDVPMTALFALTLWAAWEAFGQRSGARGRWAIVAGILWGLTLGTKINALVIPPILLVWLALVWLWPRFRLWRQGTWRRLLLPAALFVCLGGLTVVAVWPYLWADPLRRFYGVLRYFAEAGAEYRVFFEGETYVAGQTLPWRYALTYVVLTTPLLTLLLAGLGLARAIRETWRGESSASALWLVWLGATLVRVSLPGMVIYNGVRHIMELLPVLCILAGLGADWLWGGLRRLAGSAGACPRSEGVPGTEGVSPALAPGHHVSRKTLFVAGGLLLAAFVAPQAVRLAELHPYEGAFFNLLAGGERGASERYTLEYWAQSYKDGAAWLNEHAGPQAWVALPIAGHLARFSLRADLEPVLTDQVAPLQERAGEGYVMFMRNRDWYDGPTSLPSVCEAQGTPIYTLAVRGAPILRIYRWPLASSSQGGT